MIPPIIPDDGTEMGIRMQMEVRERTTKMMKMTRVTRMAMMKMRTKKTKKTMMSQMKTTSLTR